MKGDVPESQLKLPQKEEESYYFDDLPDKILGILLGALSY